MAYIKKIWKDYPDTTTQIKAEDLNNIENGIETVDTVVNSGWIDANETWTYSSVDNPTGVITITGDKTTKYSLGMRIKFTNATNVIYGIITKISYSSPNTTLTFLHEINPSNSLALYLMANSAITNNYYSNMKVPYGFPMNPAKWSIIVSDTTDRSQVTSGTTIYNLGGINITIPIGLWKVKYKGLFQIGSGIVASNAKYMTISLSTANNTIIADNAISIAGADIKLNRLYSEKTIDNLILTSKTKYYLNARDDGGAGNTIYFLNAAVGGLTLYITAECAYL